MKKKYFLPIEKPTFYCYNHYACADGIVRANARENFPVLLCVKYINCVYREEETRHQFIISMFDAWWTHQNVMQSQQLDFFKSTLQKTKTNLVLLIKKCLLLDLYVMSCCNRKYFEPDADEQHEFLYFVLTGYDDIKREFTLYAEPNLEAFECYKIGYDDFVDAMFNNSNSNINLSLRKYNPKANLELDLPNIAIELNDYINSTNCRQHYTADKLYGFRAIEALAQKLESDLESLGMEVGGSYLHKFAMHKRFMKERIAYLAQKGIVDCKWIHNANEIWQLADNVEKMGMSYYKTKDFSKTHFLLENMLKTIEMELSYLPIVLSEIKVAMNH